MDTKELISKLEKSVPKAVMDVRPFGRKGQAQPSAWIEMKSICSIAQALVEEPELGLDWLESLTVFQVEDALVLTYFVRSSRTDASLILRGTVVPAKPDQEVEVPSVIEHWPMAREFEREAQELFGIRFEGGSRKSETPWDGFPLRKSFSLPKVGGH